MRPASRKSCLEGEGLHLFRYPSPLRDRLGQPAAPAVTPFLRSAVLLVVERSYTPSCTVAFGQYNRFLFWLLLLLAAKLLRRVGSTAGTYLLYRSCELRGAQPTLAVPAPFASGLTQILPGGGGAAPLPVPLPTQRPAWPAGCASCHSVSAQCSTTSSRA